MIRQEYLDYVAGFSNLNPYELDHMSEMLHVQMEKFLFNNSDQDVELPFSASDLKDIITKTMRGIYIELAHAKKIEFDQQLEKIKAMTFIPEELNHDEGQEHTKAFVSFTNHNKFKK